MRERVNVLRFVKLFHCTKHHNISHTLRLHSMRGKQKLVTDEM